MINLVGGGSERTSKLRDRERCSSGVVAAAAAGQEGSEAEWRAGSAQERSVGPSDARN